MLTYKVDGLAEKRQNENGKIDYFVAREMSKSWWISWWISWDVECCGWDWIGDTKYGSSGDFMVNEWEMMIQRELMRFYGDVMGLV